MAGAIPQMGRWGFTTNKPTKTQKGGQRMYQDNYGSVDFSAHVDTD